MIRPKSAEGGESSWTYFVVASVEEVIPEALNDGRADLEDSGQDLSANHHVAVVQLHVHIRLFVDHVIDATSRRQANQLPVVTAQLVPSWCLRGVVFFKKEGR